MSTLELKVYEIFKSKLGESEASAILEYIDEKAEKKIAEKKDVLLTKDDKIQIIEKIAETKVDIMRWMFGVFAMLMLAIIGLYFKH
jgi:hypothetical protein